MANQKVCGIWLEDVQIISELRIKQGLSITWETSDSADIEKSREVATDKIQAMAFIQKYSRRHNGLRSETGKKMLKVRDGYPTTVTSPYNLML